ncbi:MAG: elongation factor P [Gaiellales bacterium]|nr:elongation factor P [Gaiellales bacterium]
MISANDFRAGMVVRFEGDLYQVVEYQHVKPGKGGAFVRTKLRNLNTGGAMERTLRPEQKYDQVRTEKRPMVYLYEDGDDLVFMDKETYDQLSLSKESLGGKIEFMKVDMPVDVVYVDEAPFDVELPILVELEIVETAPGVKGDTVSGGSKTAVLETGATIQVPLFIEQGETIRVDTRTGAYNSRV